MLDQTFPLLLFLHQPTFSPAWKSGARLSYNAVHNTAFRNLEPDATLQVLT